MEVKSEKKENKQPLFTKLAENQAYRKVIIIACLIGIALIFLSSIFKNDNSEPNNKPASDEITAQQYTLQLEKNLTDIVTRIQGAGNAKVLVTLERGTENIYATEEKKSNQTTEDKSNGAVTNEANDNTEKKYIIIKDSNGGQRALAVTQVQPIIKGVVVVCDGGDNSSVQQNIVSAVTTALDISSVRVCVIKAK